MSLTQIRPLWLVVASSLWMSTIANVALWRELYSLNLMADFAGVAFGGALALLTATGVAALLDLFAWRWTLKPVVSLFLVVAAAGAYFMLTYRVVIDSTMIVNVLQTDQREAFALFNVRMIGVLVVLAGLPCWLLWRTDVAFARWPVQGLRNLGFVLAALGLALAVVFASFQPLASVMRNHAQLRYLINPLNTVYALGHAASKPLRRNESKLEPVGLDAKPGMSGPRPPLLVLVVGETARSGNFGLNGYVRPTTPMLSQGNVASFANVWSCGTSTASSLPCMFSPLGRSRFESRDRNYETLVDVLQRAGLAVLWLDNQSGCKGVCDRVPSVDVSNLKNPKLCSGGECRDEIFLDGLDERLAALPAERRAQGVVLVMHQMGSHGPAYYLRSPPSSKQYLPECITNNLQNCSQAEVVNAYDNSIVYTDKVLASTIDWLKKYQAQYDTAMVYVSDHGESLGENSLYLHGMPYSIAPDVQKRVPWITWLSSNFERRSRVTTTCLQQRSKEKLSHDFLFHSILGLLNVQTSVYQAGLDAYAPCVSS